MADPTDRELREAWEALRKWGEARRAFYEHGEYAKACPHWQARALAEDACAGLADRIAEQAADDGTNRAGET